MLYITYKSLLVDLLVMQNAKTRCRITEVLINLDINSRLKCSVINQQRECPLADESKLSTISTGSRGEEDWQLMEYLS